jgi:hypothetical protein
MEDGVARPEQRTYSVIVRSLQPGGGYQNEAFFPDGGHRLRTDKSASLGGTGTGPGSFDLLTAGLAN